MDVAQLHIVSCILQQTDSTSLTYVYIHAGNMQGFDTFVTSLCSKDNEILAGTKSLSKYLRVMATGHSTRPKG